MTFPHFLQFIDLSWGLLGCSDCLAGLLFPYFLALTHCAWFDLPRQTWQCWVWWKCIRRQSWDSLIPIQNGTEMICTAELWPCLYHPQSAPNDWPSTKCCVSFRRRQEKKTHFSYLLFFALLSSTVLKTKLILDLVNLPFNMTMQRISFYLGFAFYKYFILSFVQSPSRTLATLSIFFRYLLSWSKNFLQIAQF